ncbi:hypothetical protein FNYG_04424 [Fusarium nygamai]|uniref:Uncharacterized protein n=1 Tax=Gibberella nygamai TaxID=42673 RepID=A0A2K0WJ27_GIBNY|nr:hypothetical protein FNYG_04424 [Fusarium nygamai]
MSVASIVEKIRQRDPLDPCAVLARGPTRIPAYVEGQKRAKSSVPAPAVRRVRRGGQGGSSWRSLGGDGGEEAGGANNDGDDDPEKPGPGNSSASSHTQASAGRSPTFFLSDAREQLQSTGVFERRSKHALEAPAKIEELMRRSSMIPEHQKGSVSQWLSMFDRWSRVWDRFLDDVVYDTFDAGWRQMDHRNYLREQDLQSQAAMQDVLSGRLTREEPEANLVLSASAQNLILGEVELGFIRRCAPFDRCSNAWDKDEIQHPESTEHRVAAIMIRMRRYVQARKVDPRASSRASVAADHPAFLRLMDRCPENETIPKQMRPLVSRYLEFIACIVVGSDDGQFQKHLASFRNPERDHHFSRERMCGYLGYDLMLDFLGEWQARQLQSDRLRDYIGRRSKVHLFEGIDRPGVVTLALFDTNVACEDLMAIKEVSPLTLNYLGWHCQVSVGEDGTTSSRYCRWEGHQAEVDGQGLEAAFLVGMDGEILGLLASEDGDLLTL